MTPDGITILPLTLDDFVKRWDGFLHLAGDDDYWPLSAFLKDMPDKWKLSFAAYDPEPIGYAIVSRKGPDHIHLHRILVAPGKRNQGIGKALLDAVKAKAPKVTLKTDKTDAARLYQREGFERIGEENGYDVYQWLAIKVDDQTGNQPL